MGDVVEVLAPVENVNDQTIVIVRWLVENGSAVRKDDPLALAETTKTTFDILAPAAGFVWRVVDAAVEVATGTVLCYVGDSVEVAKAAAASATGTSAGESRPAAAVASGSTAGGGSGTASPARFSAKAQALVHELGLDPQDFAGRGLIREQDVLALAQSRAVSQPPRVGGVDRQEPIEPPAAALGVPTRVEDLPRRKRLEIRLLRASQTHTLASSVAVAVPTGGFFSAGQADPASAGWAGAVLIFETARLLTKYPIFNAYYADGKAHYYEQVNVGYAIDAGHGLKVPVIRDAHVKSLADIAAEKQQHLVNYLADTIPLEALAGGTFTITDLSSEGVLHVEPIINDGQSAILGVCAEQIAPGATRGAYNLVLAYDHQLGDGRTAAGFLRDLRDRLIAHEASMPLRHDASAPAAEPRCARCLRPLSELTENRHHLVRTVGAGADQVVCTICLGDW